MESTSVNECISAVAAGSHVQGASDGARRCNRKQVPRALTRRSPPAVATEQEVWEERGFSEVMA